MTDQIYMNGRGVMRRTRELIDALWDAVPAGILGTTVAICSVVAAVLAAIFGNWLVTVSCVAPGAVGVWAASFWFAAEAELKAHTKAMQDETAKHGKGWADGT